MNSTHQTIYMFFCVFLINTRKQNRKSVLRFFAGVWIIEHVQVCLHRQPVVDTYIWTCELVHVCTTQTPTHTPRCIISRNIISHIAVMTLGRYVDYTVGKQQAADWVIALPYITSLHSSLFFYFFYCPHFSKSDPTTSPASRARFQAMHARWCEVI